MGVVRVSSPTGLCQENSPLSYVSLVRATYCTEYGQEPGCHRIGSVHGVIWQAGTNDNNNNNDKLHYSFIKKEKERKRKVNFILFTLHLI